MFKVTTPRLRRPRAVLVDLGGALAKFTYDEEAGIEHLVKLHTGDLPGFRIMRVGPSDFAGEERCRAEKRERLRRSFDEMRKILPAAPDAPVETPILWLLRVAVRVADALPWDGDLSDLERRFAAAALRCAPEPGVVEALAAADEAGIRLGIVTNSPFTGATLRKVLAADGIHSRFWTCWSSADHGVRKPAPIAFRAALSAVGVSEENTWHVGDNPVSDAAGAKAAGLTAILYDPDGRHPDAAADARIASWSEFAGLLEAAR